MFVVTFVSGGGLCDWLITCPDESYRMWRVWVWSWSLDNQEALAHFGLLHHGGKMLQKMRGRYIGVDYQYMVKRNVLDTRNMKNVKVVCNIKMRLRIWEYHCSGKSSDVRPGENISSILHLEVLKALRGTVEFYIWVSVHHKTIIYKVVHIWPGLICM